VRITAPLDMSKPGWHDGPVRPQQIPFADLAQSLVKALTVPLDAYQVVTVAGKSRRCPWSLAEAERVLGYVPTIDLDSLGVNLVDPFAVDAQ
jgi:hypothetical protein